MADIKNVIRKINTGTSEYDIDAKYWGGKTYEQLADLIHGGVETYVIPTSKSTDSNYGGIVNSTASTVEVNASILKNLVGTTNDFKIGDIILVEAVSNDSTNKGEKAFDRWVSNITGEGNTTKVKLSVLETQVATHHHTFGADKGKALIEPTPTSTTYNVAKVGTAVSVLSKVSGTFVTSVAHDDNGDFDINFTTTKPEDTKIYSSHSHTITPNTLVSRTVDLISDTYTPHTHSTKNVAGAATAAASFKYINGGTNTVEFIKTVTDASTTTDTGSSNPGTSSTELTTEVQTSTDSIGNIVYTVESGSHTHSVSVSTSGKVITSVDIAPKVVTSVSYSAPSVQASVLTSIVYSTNTKAITSFGITAPSSSFLSSCIVNEDGVLSFVSANAVTSAAVTSVTSKNVSVITSVSRDSQSNGDFASDSTTQTFASENITLNGSAQSAGGHKHGFSHTHTIAEHSHTVNSHTHTYYKTVASTKGTAYTSLTSSIHYPHTHNSNSVTVADVASNSTKISYIKGFDNNISVIRDLKDSAVSTNTQYLVADITFPGITAPTSAVSFEYSDITPAVDSNEKAITSITFTSGQFITGFKSGSDHKTSGNIGGN